MTLPQRQPQWHRWLCGLLLPTLLGGCAVFQPQGGFASRFTDPPALSPYNRSLGVATSDPPVSAVPQETSRPVAPSPHVANPQDRPPRSQVRQPLDAPDPMDSTGSRQGPPRGAGSAQAPRAAPLTLDVTHPEQAPLGESLLFTLRVRNDTPRAAENAAVLVRYGQEWEFPGSTLKAVEQKLGRLAGGASRELSLSLIPRSDGTQCVEIRVTSDTHEPLARSACVRVTPAAAEVTTERRVVEPVPADAPLDELVVPDAAYAPGRAAPPRAAAGIDIEVAAPDRRTLGSRAEYVITLSNLTGRDLQRTHVRARYDEPLVLKEVSAGAERFPGALDWDLGTLFDQERIQIQIEFECAAESDAACMRLAVVSEGTPLASREVCLHILPQPLLDLRIDDADDPLEADQQSSVTIRLTNTGREVARNVRLELALPPQLDVTSVRDARTGDAVIMTPSAGGIAFPPLAELQPGAERRWLLDVSAKSAGVAEWRALLSSDLLPAPVEVRETTLVNPPVIRQE